MRDVGTMTQTRSFDRRPVVISGPSGVGKGTLCQRLFDAYPNTFALTTSHTTRQPRAGEVEGVNYFYVSTSTFTSLISQDAFVEYTTFGGNYYGTSKQTIEDQTAKGLVVVLDIEMEGVKRIKASSGIDARYVFIKPPSFEALEARLRGRGTEKEEDIQKRLAQAAVELEYANTHGVHDKIIVNDDLDKSFAELEDFIFGKLNKVESQATDP
ncbi:P-loop containing nucleoside triphosphate hydrolase protein [Elsinoe ampelina]|uniref:Guanylate kinase n=1 Tax=Elsinoe ampelina TaxID=302913 RepID=A0A6A6G6S3_9PEZI|nr:P-loop containing nucleoside triphosphate hydrolase protein [Elsinoe ampelina]